MDAENLPTTPTVIRPARVASWLYGIMLVAVDGGVLSRLPYFIHRHDIGSVAAGIVLLIFISALCLNLLTARIILSAESIARLSLFLRNLHMLKSEIASRHGYQGGNGAQGIVLKSIHPDVRDMRMDITMLDLKDIGKINNFLRDIPLTPRNQRRKKKH